MSSTGTSTVSASGLGSRASTMVTGRQVAAGPSVANSAWRSSSTDASARARGATTSSPHARGAAPAPPRKRATSSSGPLRRRQTDALRRAAADRLEPLEREREVRAALGRHERVDLVHDHRVHAAQHFARVRGEQQEERLGRRDEDVGRLPRGSAGARWPACRPCARRRPARGTRCRAPPRCRVIPAMRRPQVPLDVHGERLERRHVEHAAAFAAPRAGARTSRDRSPRGTPRASCRCRSARRRARARRAR